MTSSLARPFHLISDRNSKVEKDIAIKSNHRAPGRNFSLTFLSISFQLASHKRFHSLQTTLRSCLIIQMRAKTPLKFKV